MNNDTICAPATATGGAISIIRISGKETFQALKSIFSKDLTNAKPYTLHFGSIMNEHGDIIDEVLISIFRAPHSYTGEDAAEISCHGSSYIVHQILELLSQHGYRMAEPGEFTKRAYLNGKLDLSQAEAVADLIAATNKATHQLAFSQLRGHVSSELEQLRNQLLKLASLLELELDFSDHEDLEFADREELLILAETIDSRISSLIRSFETGQAIKDGIPVAIVGKTNVGKSTLLNQLLKEERAIVSDIHGTTRDTIEDTINLQGITFRFIDTAGIRQTSDTIEQIGIQRTYQTLEKARIILWLIDQQPTDEELQDMLQRTQQKDLLIIQNKIDQPSAPLHPTFSLHSISAKTGQGIPELESAIYEAAHLPEIQEHDVIICNARHYQILLKVQQHLSQVLHGIHIQLSGDLIVEDLRSVINDLAQITGQERITPQETLNNIFSHFCIGK
ncbi:MAG: tRNA uridine-5-carboxymethylaminomethyl(34) synthesis GTPase MnmE [Bacteroidales bacterium]|nr:tRNA uridine-5-carboxymethylaminomethyl(34) synthesis GTPase MnmE [Bacteroidales bacterium]